MNALKIILHSNGANPDEPGFRKNLADEVNNDGHRKFFKEDASIYDNSVREYIFKQNVVDTLEAVWDYEVKDYISANEINISKRYVINKLFKSEPMQYSIKSNDRNKALEFIDLAANNVVGQLEGII